MKKKLYKFTESFNEAHDGASINFNENKLDSLNILEDIKQIDDIEQIGQIAYSFGQNLIHKNDILKYINDKHGDYDISSSGIENIRKYSYIANTGYRIGRSPYYDKRDIDQIFSQNIIQLDLYDYFQTLNFSIKMLQKIQDNHNVRFGTFFDKIAKRKGSVLNYIERHIVGKIGELAVIKIVNQEIEKLGHNFTVENSFNTEQVEAADIVQLKSRDNVIVNANKRVQIKTAQGLNSVVLKEDVSKLNSQTFGVDYCAFAQVLGDPLAFFIDFIYKMGVGYNPDSHVEEYLSEFLQSHEFATELLRIKVKVAGFIGVEEMKSIKKDEQLPPLGPASGDSYYSYVHELERDFSILAKDILPERTIR